MEKKCFKCKRVKPLSEFYKHPGMKDGRLNKCKDCNKKDVHWNYLKRRKQYAEYEKGRFQEPGRRVKTIEYQRKRRRLNEQQYKANGIVARALRSGKLSKQVCEMCEKVPAEAHHEDYSKPLDVVWLCRKHHLAIHGKEAYEF